MPQLPHNELVSDYAYPKKIIFAVGFVVLLVAVFFVGKSSGLNSLASPAGDVTQANTKYKFISPLLEYGDYQASNLMNNDATDIEHKLSDYIDAKKKTGTVDDVSIYFRDLNNGPYVNINAKKMFIPGSLLKLPIAISAYKQAEKTPEILQKKTTFKTTSPDLDAGQHFKPEDRIKKGMVYSLEDLIHYMLADSDNNAAVLAIDFLNQNDLISSYADLGLDAPVGTGQYTLSVKSYASFFRILYNASYLNQTNSEQVLSILAQSTFTDALAAGVPSNIVVSHKFGERGTSAGKVQLHDCGIIYKPNQPYVLCVMTEGSNFDILTSTIADISGLVYKTLNEDN